MASDDTDRGCAAGAGAAHCARPALLQITIVQCVAPRSTRQWTVELPQGATVVDALRAADVLECSGAAGALERPSAAGAPGQTGIGAAPAVGIWGRPVAPDARLQHLDRVEIYRPLKADPKLARRQRFARQGARGAGLFARRRPGDRPGD